MTESDIRQIACDIALELTHAGAYLELPGGSIGEAEIAEIIASRLRAYVQRQAGGEQKEEAS